MGGAEMTVFLGGEFGVLFWGAYHQTQNGTQVPGPSAKPVRGSAGIEGLNSIGAGLGPIRLYPIGPF